MPFDRTWGWWTRAKLQILEDYLAAFLAASGGKSKEAVYIDAFAGAGLGKDRLTDEEFDGSARIGSAATATGSSGFQFTRLRFFELNERRAHEIQAEFRSEFPNRDIAVIAGDCNSELPRFLREMPAELTYAPTFAFLDPFGIELKWATIQALADHKRNRKFKVELWMLFSSPAMMRLAGGGPERAAQGFETQLSDLFGNRDWEPIVKARRAGDISARLAREAFVNLMRWRIEQSLGYARTHVLEFKDAHGRPLYHMIFATDHDAGDRIMAHLYAAAAKAHVDMAQEARVHVTGAPTLFSDSAVAAPKYVPEPPTEPTGLLQAMIGASSARA